MSEDLAVDKAILPLRTAIRRDSKLLALEHLQLNKQVTLALRSKGLKSIADVFSYVLSDAFRTFGFKPELTAAIRVLQAATRGDETDWWFYWSLSGDVFHHLAADLPELRDLSDASRSYAVNREAFGNAGAMLQRAGFETLGQLADSLVVGILDVRGMGHTKVQEFFGRLRTIIEAIREDGEEAALGTPIPTDQPEKPMLPDTVSDLPVSVLHIGSKAHHLRAAGIQTLGELSEVSPISCRDFHGIGQATLFLIDQRLEALSTSVTETGEVNWEDYCSACGIPLVPVRLRPSSGTEFLSSLPDLLVEIAGLLPDPVQAEILRSRLSRVPADRKSLEEIARGAVPPITRERIRQKEAKLLRQIAGGLIWDRYSGLGIHFHPTFSKWWRLAADQFMGSDDIGFEDFLRKLADAWEVDVPAIMHQLPIILAIVTGEPGMPPGFRGAIRIPAAFYGELRPEVREIKWSRLRVGKSATQVQEIGFTTVGEFVDGCRSGEIAEIEFSATKQVRAHLDVLGECLGADGQIDWDSYRIKHNLRRLPESPPASAREFVDELPATIDKLLLCIETTGRAPDIFRLRTSWPSHSRKTLEQTAAELHTYGPSIKREETVLLQQLNEIILGKAFSLAAVWIDEVWLRFWKEAADIFVDAGGDLVSFERSVADRWGVADADRAFAILWAVLSGYPEGRPAPVRKERTAPPTSSVAPAGRIKLTGFRRLH